MAKSSEEKWSKKILAAVKSIDRPGAFCTQGIAEPILPGLQVNGIGLIGLPLSREQAKILKQKCDQAGYGKGTETVVDTNVRRVWKLKSDQFRLANPKWETALSNIMINVQRELGLEDQKLKPHLYDLLLYEKGSFFLPHRDGEKMDGMVATLVIVLPSAFSGGQLVVRHDDQEQIVDFANNMPAIHTQYAAFYADCEHEVKPLVDGHRLCLIYNLTVSKSARNLSAPRQKQHVENIANILSDWNSGKNHLQKIALTLEHQYTKTGLNWAGLKGVDRAKANILAEAAKQCGCHAYLALLTFHESGATDEDYSPRRRSHFVNLSSNKNEDDYDNEYGDDEDEDEHDDSASDETSGYEMIEVYETSLTADQWQAVDGSLPGLGALPVEEDEILPAGSLKKVKPERDVSGYTGNEGLTLERWYRRAAIILWPDVNHFDVVCSGGVEQAVGLLPAMVAGLPSASGSDAEKPVERLKLFLTTILNRWPEDQQNHFYPWSPPSIDEARKNTSTVLIGVLDSVNDIKLINKFLRKVLRHDAGVEANSQLINIIARHGWTPFGEAIKCYFDASTIETICKDVRFLSLICQAAFKTTKKELAAKAQQICRPLPNKIVEILALKVNSEIAELKTMSKSTRVELLTGLTISLLALDSNQLLETFVGQVLAYPKQFILQTVQLPVLVETGGWLRKNRKNVPDAVKKWLSDGIEKLLSLTANEPAPPTNFKRDAKLRCNCKHCKELIEFLQNATEHQHEFQMVEHKRRHLEEQIRDSLCDLDVSTIRKSRPQILVCTKNMASHQRLVKAFKDNQQHLKTLRGLKSGD